jgi:hypothetical protein
MIRTPRWMTAGVGLSLAAVIALIAVGCFEGAKKDDGTAPPVEKEKGVTILLVSPATAEGLSCELSKGLKKDYDHVRWFNQTTTPVTITFTPASPFLEAEMIFTVSPNEFSPYYTLDTKKVSGPYIYTTVPQLIPSSGGPGEPKVIVGD